MKKVFRKGSDINKTIKDIMESQQDFRVTQLSSLSFQQCCIGFYESHSKVNNYFYNANLSLMISDFFSGVLNTLANILNTCQSLTSLEFDEQKEKKTKKSGVQSVMHEIFTDDDDHTFFDAIFALDQQK